MQYCRIIGKLIVRYCGFCYNYTRINWCNRSVLFSAVYVDNIRDIKYRRIAENFYFCNRLHTLRKLNQMIEVPFMTIRMECKNSHSTVTISNLNNSITVDYKTKRIILGDISLSYIFS